MSARPETSDLPKAHVLNQRAMEILEDCGVADEVAARSTPAEQMAATAYYAGFAGDDRTRAGGSRGWSPGAQAVTTSSGAPPARGAS